MIKTYQSTGVANFVLLVETVRKVPPVALLDGQKPCKAQTVNHKMRHLAAAAGGEGGRAACGWLGRRSEARGGGADACRALFPRAVLALQLSSVAAECQTKCRCFLCHKVSPSLLGAPFRERVVERWNDACNCPSVQGQGLPCGLDGWQQGQLVVPNLPGLCAARSMQAHARRSAGRSGRGKCFRSV